MHGGDRSPKAGASQAFQPDSADVRLESLTYLGEKWRSTANFWRRSRLDATRRHRRKAWQTSGLRSRTVRCGHGEMALETPEKAPFRAIFQHVFDGFLQVLLRACPRGRQLAPMRSRKALVLNHAQSQTDARRSCKWCMLPSWGEGGPRGWLSRNHRSVARRRSVGSWGFRAPRPLTSEL